jgi:hypothetical protein
MFIKNAFTGYYQFYNQKPYNINIRNRTMSKYRTKIFDISYTKTGLSNIKRLLTKLDITDEEREDIDSYIDTLYYTTGRFLNRLAEFFEDIFSTRKYPIRSRVARYSMSIPKISKIPLSTKLKKPISSHVKGGSYGKKY